MSQDWRGDVLKFWFALERDQWWGGGPDLDHRIRQRFLKLWAEKRQLPAESFLADPLSALAAVVLFDQFPRNMFRDDARAFATDVLARCVATGGVDRGFDQQVPPERRLFFYMPFEHSEDLKDQERCLRLTGALGRPDWTTYAKKHHDVIARFGRFPHRNEVLGRQSTEEEIAFGLEPAW